jgi:urease accessory protein
VNLSLLHLCDSLFPIGGFAYSDGLETATTVRLKPDTTDGTAVRLPAPRSAEGKPDATCVEPADVKAAISDSRDLCDWIDVCLDETMGRLEGPAVWQAWAAFRDADWAAIATLDEDLHALRPSSSARRSSRAMGLRLLTTWQTLHPDPRIEQALTLARRGRFGPALPIAFAGACTRAGIERRCAVEAFAYTRLAATISAAMRLMPIGQTDAHTLLARTLDRVPAVVDGIIERNARIESFSPALDIAAMTQQYLHSRLFRS